MKTSTLIVALGATAMLAACSSKSASKGNFERAIDTHFEKHCLEVDPATNDFNDAPRYPAVITLFEGTSETTKQANEEEIAPYEALVKAGLLSVEDGITPGTFSDRPHKKYTLTALGKISLKGLDSYDTVTFCAGHLVTTDIAMFTEPAVSNGLTMTQVTFTAKAVDVPAWALSKDIGDAMPEVVRWRDPVGKRQLWLVLTNKGWIVNGDQAL